MNTTAINPLTSSGTGVLGSSAASYGDNPFLRLLTAQLQNQTPLEPVDNESFMNQMASYSSMQEQRELNTNMLKLLDYQGLLARIQSLSEGSSLLGKEVTYADADGDPQTGRVSSVFVNDQGEVRLKLENGEDIDMRLVSGIAEPTAA